MVRNFLIVCFLSIIFMECKGQSREHYYCLSQINITNPVLKCLIDEYIIPLAKKDSVLTTNDLISVSIYNERLAIRIQKDVDMREEYVTEGLLKSIDWGVYLSSDYPVLVITDSESQLVSFTNSIYTWRRFGHPSHEWYELFNPYIWWFFTIDDEKIQYKDSMLLDSPFNHLNEFDKSIAKILNCQAIDQLKNLK